MKRLVVYLLFVLIYLPLPIEANPKLGNIICKQTYALCSAAPCMTIPGRPNQAICFCVVKQGLSVGNISCDTRKPGKNRDGQKILVSNFSFANDKTHKLLSCHSGTPWTFCLDKPCLVDPNNPKKAICTCDVKRIGAFVTFGGHCNKKACKTTLWSAANHWQISRESNELAKKLGLGKIPYQQCQ